MRPGSQWRASDVEVPDCWQGTHRTEWWWMDLAQSAHNPDRLRHALLVFGQEDWTTEDKGVVTIIRKDRLITVAQRKR